MPELQQKLDVLLKECDHVQESVSRFLSAITTVFGFGLPAVLGIFLFLAKNKGASDSQELMAVGLAAVMSVVIMFTNAMWMEALQGMRYKYTTLHPRLYALIGETDWENYGQYLARNREPTHWVPMGLLNSICLIVGVVLPMYLVCNTVEGGFGELKQKTVFLIAISLGFVTAAAISTACVVRSMQRINQLLKKDSNS